MEGNGVVSELLSSSNYVQWSIQVKTYLLGQGLWWDTLEAELSWISTHSENSVWIQRNALALHAIQKSCGQQAFAAIKDFAWAKHAWDFLKNAHAQAAKGQIDPNVGDFQVYQHLFNAVYHGDWDAARTFLDQNPEAVKATAPGSGKNALHVAVSQGHLHIVERLVERMTEQDLEMQDAGGFTSLAVAVHYGYSSIARCLIRNNIRLLSIENRDYYIPVVHAVLCSQMQMSTYLYSVTPLEALTSLDQGRHGAFLLGQCIIERRFDIALDLMERAPVLAFTEAAPGASPVTALSLHNVFPSRCSLRFWQQWIYDCIKLPNCATNRIFIDIQNLEDSQHDKNGKTIKSSGVLLHCREAPLNLLRWMASNLLELLDIKKIREMKLVHIQSQEFLNRVCKVIESTSNEMQLVRAVVSDAIIRAARIGNVEFIRSIAKANPELVWNSFIARGVFDVAIDVRQANVFSLIYGLPDKVALASYIDSKGNNMIHKAASVAPSRLLNLIPGAALQMQRELQWYKEVESLASRRARIWTNNEGFIPREIFTESHRDLVVTGEKWMKDTSSSCTVVGALIITVTFAAAFTFPGGNNQNTGLPMFANRKLFNVFMISNAIALFTSTTSVLMFLGILTSRYAEEDFLESLPKKLIIGLSTLFLSIAAMIVAFCAGLSIMFREELWIVIPSVCLASIPIAFFARMQFPLLVDIFMSTYGPSIFNRNVKRWI